MAQASAELEERVTLLVEKERELTAERLLCGLDQESREELSDSVWLKREVNSNQ